MTALPGMQEVDSDPEASFRIPKRLRCIEGGREGTHQSPKENLCPLSFLIRGRNMCHAMTNSCPHVRAGHSNCSAQQKAEIPIQSLESSRVGLIPRTALRRKLDSVATDISWLQRRTDDTIDNPAAIFYIAPPSLPLFPAENQ